MPALRNALVIAFVTLLGSAALAVGATGTALADREHRVRSGESLARIARRYRIRMNNLRAANRLGASARIRPGQVLVIPDRGAVYVRSGQTLSHIARDNDTSVGALARENHLRAGRPLRVGQRLWLPGHSATIAEAVPHDWGPPPEAGVVRLRTHTEEATVLLRAEEGHIPRASLEALARLMHRGDEDDGPDAAAVRTPEPRLALIVAAMSDHFGGRQVYVVSGFREVRGFTRETSRHVQGRAVDIRLAGVSKRALWDFCRSLSGTGCGLYPRSSFVHVDVRDQEAQWVDWSGPGQPHRYGNLRGPFRRRGPRRREGRSITRPSLVPQDALIDEPARFSSVWELEPSR